MFDGVALSKYLGVFGGLIGAGMGLPIPEEIPVVTAGAFVGHDSQAVIDATRAGEPVPPGLTHWWGADAGINEKIWKFFADHPRSKK